MAITENSWQSIQPLRIPGGWQILFHKLTSLEPAQLKPEHPAWLTVYTQDILCLSLSHTVRTHKETLRYRLCLDLGWYPDGDPNGCYRLVAVRNGCWEKPLRQFETRSTADVVATLESWLWQNWSWLPPISQLRFEITTGTHPDFVALSQDLDQNLNDLLGGEEKRAPYLPFVCLDKIKTAILYYDKDTPIACGGFQTYDATTAELKRVFVSPAYRGTGLAERLLNRLEKQAKAQGYQALILETGEPLAAAVKLYQKLGYSRIPNYGPYVNMEDSLCMKKRI